MGLSFWIIQTFNGISYGALLFLLGAGLSLIFGVMRIVNLSHGSYFLLGGYVALTVIWTTGSWLLSIPVAALTIALVGLLMERLFLRPLGFDPLRQVLLTVGFAFLFQQAALDLWTGNNFDINPPEALTDSIQIAGLYLPLYRVFMIATALAVLGGVLGCVGLLLRRKWALPVLGLSLIGILVQDYGLFVLVDGAHLAGSGAVVTQGLVLAIGIGLVWLSGKARARGWLR